MKYLLPAITICCFTSFANAQTDAQKLRAKEKLIAPNGIFSNEVKKSQKLQPVRSDNSLEELQKLIAPNGVFKPSGGGSVKPAASQKKSSIQLPSSVSVDVAEQQRKALAKDAVLKQPDAVLLMQKQYADSSVSNKTISPAKAVHVIKKKG